MTVNRDALQGTSAKKPRHVGRFAKPKVLIPSPNNIRVVVISSVRGVGSFLARGGDYRQLTITVKSGKLAVSDSSLNPI